MSTPRQQQGPKTMSSRLSTMKFMQRAAAATPPKVSQAQTQSTDGLPSKRQKTSDAPTTSNASPSLPQSLGSTIDEAQGKQERVLEKLAEEAGETKWVLSIINGDGPPSGKNLQIVSAGYSDIDHGPSRPVELGRKSFGQFNRDLERRQKTTDHQSSSPSEEGSNNGDPDDDEDGDEDCADRSNDPNVATEALEVKRQIAARTQRKEQKRAKKAELARLAEKRRSKEVKLNKLTSISGGGDAGGTKESARSNDRECYLCGQKGHEKRNCPQKTKRKRENRPSHHSKDPTIPLDY